MGLFGSSKEDKETIKRLLSQIEQQQIIIESLNKNIYSLQSILAEKAGKENINEKEEITNDSIIEIQKREISRLNDIIREQNERIELLNEESSRLGKIANEIPNNKEIILGAGKYKGGIDLPIGCYELKLQSGIGDVETNKPENIYFRMTKNTKEQEEYGWIDEYNNLEISEKTILKISESAKVEFSLSKKYDFSKEMEESKREYDTKKKIFDEELETIKSEIRILNNDLIKKYYDFSDYDNISSQECRNKLTLLKQKEQELREQGKDVVIRKMYGKNNKMEERIIRQMLRTFNAECDNIMINISLKNIDRARKQVQNSFETINKLYMVDFVELHRNLLEVKLEQITLMYTYELKYQQEKDIQRAIKEQMVEEAKAQREIEEQKKKIEKDLQQHLGEVNRLMKYLQKTQVDAEKQLYMDKIKELEDKIKILESDKKTVMEREANAKAGFVYIISNIGSFGDDIYKIGMTRRLEPMDRINELSSASVPFEFDVHAMIFSSDAPELETMLHRHFSDRAVNKVNPRKEFYKVDIDEIERVVKENYNDTVQFTKIPLAIEYRQSLNM